MSYMISVEAVENGTISPLEFVSVAFSDESKAGSKVPADFLEKLSQRSKDLERELRSAVFANSDELLKNASDVKGLRDNVLELKDKIAGCRNQTQHVAGSLLDPFNNIQKATRQLNSYHSICKELITLQRFLRLYKQYKAKQGKDPGDKISSVTPDMKKVCEMQRIATSGELDKITVYQTLWSEMAPECEKLMRLADEQLTSCIEKNESSSQKEVASACMIFILLGTGRAKIQSLFQKITNDMIQHSKIGMMKCYPENLVAWIECELTNMCSDVAKVFTVYQAFNSAINQTQDADVQMFDTEEFSPQAAMKDYTSKLGYLMQQEPTLHRYLVADIPEIRKVVRSIGSKLSTTVEQSEAFTIMMNPFIQYQNEFVKELHSEMKNGLFRLFILRDGSRDIDPKQIELFCENLSAKLGSFDKELLNQFRGSILQLAKGFAKLSVHENQTMRDVSRKYKTYVMAGLKKLGNKHFDEETGNEVVRYMSK